jgi:predicted SprT family Zn-dependent metalloprotease
MANNNSEAVYTMVSDSFMKSRADIAHEMFNDLNTNVFDARLRDVDIVWSDRLRRTAGRWEVPKNNKPCRIVLSTAMLTDETRLINTLAHEMCHVAVYQLDQKTSCAHNDNWLRWTRKVMKEYNDIDISALHSYPVDVSASYVCSNCSFVHRLTEEAIDVKRCRCTCGGALLFINKSFKS